MPTPQADAMRQLVTHLAPELKNAGFRKRRHTFNRTVEPGLVHVIKYQLGPADPPGVEEIPGVHMNLAGLFGVDLGVYLAESWHLQHGHHNSSRSTTTGTPESPSAMWVNDYDCDIRAEIGSDAADQNWMFTLANPQGMAELQVQLLHSQALPWLEGFRTRTAILEQLEAAPVDSRDICGDAGAGPDRLLAVRMHLGSGNLSAAQHHFEAWVDHCRSEMPPGAGDDGHLKFLADFAAANGLTMLLGNRC